MSKKVWIVLLIPAVVFLAGCAKKSGGDQEAREMLAITDHQPVVDGKIADGEYPVMINLSKMKVYLARTAGRLSFGIEADDMGWIAFGVGKRVMNDAQIFIGYVEGDSSRVEEMQGMGNRHEVADLNLLTAYALQEDELTTSFEGTLDATRVIAADQAELDIIVACGRDDNFMSYHTFRAAHTVGLK